MNRKIFNMSAFFILYNCWHDWALLPKYLVSVQFILTGQVGGNSCICTVHCKCLQYLQGLTEIHREPLQSQLHPPISWYTYHYTCLYELAQTYLQLPLRQWGASLCLCLSLSMVQLRGKHWHWKPHCCNGVIDTFGPDMSIELRSLVFWFTQQTTHTPLRNKPITV